MKYIQILIFLLGSVNLKSQELTPYVKVISQDIVNSKLQFGYKLYNTKWNKSYDLSAIFINKVGDTITSSSISGDLKEVTNSDLKTIIWDYKIELESPEDIKECILTIEKEHFTTTEILIYSSPTRSSVFIDGDYFGLTPFRRHINCGLHNIILKNECLIYEDNIEIKRNQNGFRFKLIPSTYIDVNINSDPSNQEVMLDDKYIGTTPFQTNIPCGKHTVKIQQEDLEFNEVIDFKEGLNDYLLKLRMKYNLHVESNPKNATIYIDGKDIGKTPCKLDLSHGSHLLKIYHPKYLAKSKRMTVGDDLITKSFTLTPEYFFSIGYITKSSFIEKGIELGAAWRDLEIHFSFMKPVPTDEIRYSDFYSESASMVFGYRFLSFPIDFSAHIGGGERSFINALDEFDGIKYKSIIIGATFHFRIIDNLGLYLKPDYWINDNFMTCSFGILLL